jgi:hypothetical protein
VVDHSSKTEGCGSVDCVILNEWSVSCLSGSFVVVYHLGGLNLTLKRMASQLFVWVTCDGAVPQY